jgi:hypothetical protein
LGRDGDRYLGSIVDDALVEQQFDGPQVEGREEAGSYTQHMQRMNGEEEK